MFINDLNSAANDSVRLTVRKGSILKVGSGGLLHVGKFTKVVIESGAQLILDAGSLVTIEDYGK